MECSTCSGFRPSRKHSANRASRFRRLSVWRSRNAPPSELMVPPSKRATISRAPQAANPKPDWVQSVIAKAFLSLALTVVWKLSYATKGRLLPIACEKCGLNASSVGSQIPRGSRATRTLTGHHRSAAKEAVADGKETTEKSDTARSEDSVAVA